MIPGNGLAKVSYLPGVLPATAGSAVPEPLPGSVSHQADTRSDQEREAADLQRDRAEKISMRALTRRGQSRWELRKALVGGELDDEVVEAELDRLERVGLIDDAALAATLVRTRRERKGLGRSALISELKGKHIEQELINAALSEADGVDGDDEQSRATELALHRVPQLHSCDTTTAKRRLTGFLLRKGYSGSVVRAAVDEALVSRGGNPSRVQFR